MSDVGIMLDIGAGSKKFVRTYRWRNPKHRLMYLCGEPGFKDSRRKDELVSSPQKGKVLRVCAEYGNFRLPDESLAAVALNAPLLASANGIEKELVRCLRSGGMFFSAHPVGIHPALSPEYFSEIIFPLREVPGVVYDHVLFYRRRNEAYVPLTIEDGPTIVYPASPTIRDILQCGTKQRGIRYVYAGMEEQPTLRVWMKK